MAFIAFERRNDGAGKLSMVFCTECNEVVERWNAHLAHCTCCGTHHTAKLTCIEAEQFRIADRQLGDASP